MQDRFIREIESLEAIFGFLGDFFAERSVGERAEFSIKLAVEELFTNMVKYNTETSEKILIRIRLEGRQIVLELIDFDVDRFDPESVEKPDATQSIADRKVGGLGLHLVRSVVDKISYEYKNRQMNVTVVKNLEQCDV